jgi:hypothetical protein
MLVSNAFILLAHTGIVAGSPSVLLERDGGHELQAREMQCGPENIQYGVVSHFTMFMESIITKYVVVSV